MAPKVNNSALVDVFSGLAIAERVTMYLRMPWSLHKKKCCKKSVHLCEQCAPTEPLES